VDDGTGRVAPQPVGTAARTPAVLAGLAPGSYRLRLQAPGYGDVLFPLTLARAGNLAVDVALLPAADIPPGFTYVPAGRFLFGSADEDSLRRGFLHAVPIHAVDTGGYLIARRETTFGEWIEYLRASPPEVRAARAPAVQAGGFQGALSLRELPEGRWELTYRPAERTYTVRSGERLRYADRDRRVEQDWLRLPVVGLTAADAEGYARWLGTSGRVPRARLCTEWEWERGARGGDDRVFPHGRTLSPDDADYDLTYGKRPAAMGPDEVGSHAASRSPFELDDMAGNVWEWTVSSVEPQGHAARGGSFYFDVNSARVANRETPEPSFRDVSVGFRVCADLAQR
jgi:formylglycine-generating enzyme required for sulfatase activity